MKRPAPLTLALTVIAIAALTLAALTAAVLLTTSVARLHAQADNANTFDPAWSKWVVNETFPSQSSVAFHWSIEGIAANISASVVDPYNNTIYEQTVFQQGSTAGSGSFVSTAGLYEFEFDGLAIGVADVSLAIQYTYLTESPLL